MTVFVPYRALGLHLDRQRHTYIAEMPFNALQQARIVKKFFEQFYIGIARTLMTHWR